MKRDGRFPCVAILVESSRFYGRGLLHGIAEYLHPGSPWSTFLDDRSPGDELPSWLQRWNGDGMIVRVGNPSMRKAIQKMAIPVVDLGNASEEMMPNAALIRVSNADVGRLGAEHFLERGFRNFAFCGFAGMHCSDSRWAYYCKHLQDKGFDSAVYQSPLVPRSTNSSTNSQEQERLYLNHQDHLARWLKSLPRPTGLMACNDIRAQQVLMACREEGIRVPDDIAVLGVDNDEIVCDFSDPPLSSIILNAVGAGFQAAELLDRLMSGCTLPKEPILVPPVGLATRRSTDIMAVEDPNLAAALKFIWQNAASGITVDDVVAHVAVSRRLLEQRFRALLGRSPKEEILNVRIQCLQKLLAQTDYSHAKIAALAGFEHVEYMNVLFKRKTGQTPGEFRATTRPRFRHRAQI